MFCVRSPRSARHASPFGSLQLSQVMRTSLGSPILNKNGVMKRIVYAHLFIYFYYQHKKAHLPMEAKVMALESIMAWASLITLSHTESAGTELALPSLSPKLLQYWPEMRLQSLD